MQIHSLFLISLNVGSFSLFVLFVFVGSEFLKDLALDYLVRLIVDE